MIIGRGDKISTVISPERIAMSNTRDWKRLLRSNSLQIRRRAAAALIEHDDLPLEILLEILDLFPSDGFERKIERSLLKRDGTDLFESMVKRLTSTEIFIREVACKVLGRSCNLNAAMHLVPLLEDPNSRVRCAAGTGLILLANPNTIEALRRHLQANIGDYGGVRWWITSEMEKLERRFPEHSRSDVYQDSHFGLLIPNIDRTAFVAVGTFQGYEIEVVFETNTLEELKELVIFAKPLWERQFAWFAKWQKNLYDCYVTDLAPNWWKGDRELNEDLFYKLLGWPIRVQFRFCDGKFNFVLSGWSEELFSDHGIDVTGSSESAMEIVF